MNRRDRDIRDNTQPYVVESIVWRHCYFIQNKGFEYWPKMTHPFYFILSVVSEFLAKFRWFSIFSCLKRSPKKVNHTWIQELQLHDSFSLMEKSRSSNIQEMKFALAQKSSDSFCNTLKLNDNTYAGFQIYKNVPLPESTLTWGENWRRWKNAGGKIPWIQNARYLSCIFQSCKMLEHLKHSTYKSSKHAPPTCTG